MERQHLPPWFKVRIPGGPNYGDLVRTMRGLGLHTVCEEAKCPNIGDCWERRTATFLILGNICTRNCAYCAIAHGMPTELDREEPSRVAEAAAAMRLRHAVITSVNRDDLADGGAAIYAETIRQIRARMPGCTVEVLIPDFKGGADALRVVLEARPDILNHNIESVPRVFKVVRHGNYQRSIDLLARPKRWGYPCATKSGMIVGMGETWDEILGTMDDLRAVDVDILTIGQYLRPGPDYMPVSKFYRPEEFRALREEGMRRSFRHVEAGPLVRSSYHADEQARAATGLPA